MSMKRSLIAGAAGLAIAGGVFASAASLGGVNSTNLGSSATVVASCDTNGVDVDYTTTYDSAAGRYEVSAVRLAGINEDCAGEFVEVSLKKADGTSTTTARTPVTGTSQTIAVDDFPGESVDAAAVFIGTDLPA
jgi:type 1 fimbria pilin